MAKYLDSRFGKLKPYKGNPRTISDAAFTKLCASIERDPEFMLARPIVIDENNAILGGNQRQYALLELGYERIPDDWVQQVTGWSEEKKQRFVLVDNSPEGMAGEFDYDIMADNFTPDVMADAGIDFSNLNDEVAEPSFKTAEEKAEEGEYGEKNEKLKTFIEHREQAREELEELTDASFYLAAVFQDFEQKRKFVEAIGIPHDGHTFVSGLALAQLMGVEIAPVEYDFPERKVDARLSALALENPQEPPAAEAT